MVARPVVALLLLTALASGCVQEDPAGSNGSGTAPAEIPSGQPPEGEDAGAPTTHGQPKRTESAVTVTQQGGTYQAKKTVTFTNDFGGAAAADVTLTTRTGGVSADDWSEGGYEVVATLSANGASEQDARASLGLMTVTHSDSLSNGRLVLKTDIPAGPGGGGISAKVPPQPAYRLIMGTSTGGLSAEGLGGPVLTMTTNTGGITASGAFNTATLTAGTGGIGVDGTFNTLRVTTDTGGIGASVRAAASGTHAFEVGTGGIDVELTGGTDHGYDAEASTGTGSVDIDIADAADVGTQTRTQKHVRSNGFDGKAIQLKVTAESTTGGVDISG